jgi:anti-sigma-K factor RskA
MDYGHPDLADRLAAEYSLGTLRGPARRRFEALLPAHPALRTATQSWEARLAALNATIQPLPVPPGVWVKVQQQLFGAPAPVAPWWQRLGWWRGATALSGSLALAVSLVAIQLQRQPGSEAPPQLVVMAAQGDLGAGQRVAFAVSVSADRRSLVIKPLQEVRLSAQQALELWAVPASGAPRSLGLLGAGGAAQVLRTALPGDIAAFAVSLEPRGGSPTGAPTGPIVSMGKLST